MVTHNTMIATQITSRNSNHMGNYRMLKLKPKLHLNPMLKALLAVKTCTQPMVATTTTLPSGCPIGHSKASNLEDSPRLADRVHLARETASKPPIYRREP